MYGYNIGMDGPKDQKFFSKIEHEKILNTCRGFGKFGPGAEWGLETWFFEYGYNLGTDEPRDLKFFWTLEQERMLDSASKFWPIEEKAHQPNHVSCSSENFRSWVFWKTPCYFCYTVLRGVTRKIREIFELCVLRKRQKKGPKLFWCLERRDLKIRKCTYSKSVEGPSQGMQSFIFITK